MGELLKAIYQTINNSNLTDSEKISYIKDYYEVAESNYNDKQRSDSI